MDNCDLYTILNQIRDQLSENDRLRLNFIVGDSDKICPKDVNELIKLLEEINCDEAVKLLKEYARLTPTHHDENCVAQTLLPDNKHTCDSNNTLINSNNTNINPVTIVLGSRSKRKSTQKCLLLFIILSIILTILVIICFMKIIRLKIHHENKINEKTKMLELRLNETIQQLSRIELLHKQSQFTEGNTCGCTRWCNERGSLYGVCGDGHTCICNATPIDKDDIRSACTCDSWCRKQGHKNGGICGDGYTCICSKENTLK